MSCSQQLIHFFCINLGNRQDFFSGFVDQKVAKVAKVADAPKMGYLFARRKRFLCFSPSNNFIKIFFDRLFSFVNLSSISKLLVKKSHQRQTYRFKQPSRHVDVGSSLGSSSQILCVFLLRLYFGIDPSKNYWQWNGLTVLKAKTISGRTFF